MKESLQDKVLSAISGLITNGKYNSDRVKKFELEKKKLVECQSGNIIRKILRNS